MHFYEFLTLQRPEFAYTNIHSKTHPEICSYIFNPGDVAHGIFRPHKNLFFSSLHISWNYKPDSSHTFRYIPPLILDVIDIVLELQVLEITEEMCSCVPSGSFSPPRHHFRWNNEWVGSVSSVQ
jgi:hypothetical protein